MTKGVFIWVSSFLVSCHPQLLGCDELIEKYWKTQQYEKCFSGYLPLAEEGYPLAESGAVAPQVAVPPVVLRVHAQLPDALLQDADTLLALAA